MARLMATASPWPALVVSLVALTHTAHASTLVAQTVGEAFDLGSNEPLYRETHCVSGDALTHEVVYKNADNQLIAYKVLNYETGSYSPSYVQHNVVARDSIAVEMKQQQDELIITATDANRPGQPRVVSLKPSAASPVVIDAGFDAFVRENWHSLVAGESKHFQFPVAAHESLVELRIASARCSYATETDQCFSLEMNNWLMKMVSDPIELGYDANLQRLARFRGISNITDDQGEALTVDIHYRYDNVVALDCAVNDGVLSGQSTLNSSAGEQTL